MNTDKIDLADYLEDVTLKDMKKEYECVDYMDNPIDSVRAINRIKYLRQIIKELRGVSDEKETQRTV